MRKRLHTFAISIIRVLVVVTLINNSIRRFNQALLHMLPLKAFPNICMFRLYTGLAIAVASNCMAGTILHSTPPRFAFCYKSAR